MTSTTSATERESWLQSWLQSVLPMRALTGSEAVRLGRGLLLVTGLVVSAALPLLHPTAQDLTVVLAVSAAMSALLVLSLFAPWQRWSDLPTLVLPDRRDAGAGGRRLLHPPRDRHLLHRPVRALLRLSRASASGRTRRSSCCRWRCRRTSCRSAPSTPRSRSGWSVAAAVWTLLAELLAHLMRRQHLVAEMLEAASRTDELTRLANRRDLESRLLRARAGDTLVMCDLDHFKSLNDSLGHAAGDVVLRDFGQVLRGCLRGDDYAARYGGEEFVLILSETDGTQSIDVLNRLRRRWSDAAPGDHLLRRIRLAHRRAQRPGPARERRPGDVRREELGSRLLPRSGHPARVEPNARPRERPPGKSGQSFTRS